MITLELPFPPSVNHYYSYVRGRPVLSKAVRVYRQIVRRVVRAAGNRVALGPLAVRLHLHPPDQRRRDCDNAQKPILDALQQGGAFADDSQIQWLLTIKSEKLQGGRVVADIWQLDNERPREMEAPEV